MTDSIAANVNANSRPSDLKITDMRIVSGVARSPISDGPGPG